MPLSTTQYGYIIDPLVPLTDDTGRTISNGYVRIFVAGTSTPVITYKNFDGATNEETVQLDNSGRTAYPVIGSKGSTYKVCVYDAEHSQETPIKTIDKVVPTGASVSATNIVTGLDNVESPEAGWVKSTVSGTDAEVSLDATNVTSEVDTMVKATAASADYMMPLVHKAGSDPDKKITLGNIFKFVLNFIHSLTDTATEADLVSGNYLALDGVAGAKKLDSTTLLTKTAQNALAGNMVPAFDPTRTSENPYKAGESVAYEGKTYTFKVDHYGAWVAAEVYQLDENELTEIWLQKKIDGKCGKNIANKDTWNKLVGHYIAYNNGSVIANASFSVFIIEIGEGVELAFNKNDMHIAAFSGKILAPKETLGATAGYISGCLTSSSNRTWTTPTGCHCIAVSCYTSYLATLQIEKGAVSTQYEPYKFGVEIGDVVSLQEKLNEKLDGTVGKNLFNKDTANKILNAYVTYATGSCNALSNAGAYVIEIGEGVELAFNINDIQVSAYSRVVDLTQVSTGTAVGNYLGGLNTSASSRTFTTPTNCKSIIVSFSTYSSVIGTLQVEKGDEPTSYEPYIFGIGSDKVIDLNVYFVGKGHKFTTIQSAVDSVPSGSTIIIMPGTYDEAVDVVTSGKMLHIVGFNRDKCIITHPVDDYYAPPLEISKGLVENLTFITTGTTQQGLGAYCVHIDFSSEAGQALQFKNCNFKNTWRPCAGIGLRENFTLSFVGCRFESYAPYSPIYCHEQQASDKAGQRIEIIDCSIYNSEPNEFRTAITLQESSSYTGNTATILMQRCIMKSAKGAYSQQHPAIRCIDYSSSSQPSSGGGKYLDSHTWNLDYMSEMNSEAIANASEQ